MKALKAKKVLKAINASQPSLKQIKKKADEVFSEFIRRTKSHKSGYGTCVTCGTIKRWQELQNGHYFSSARLGTRFHEDNCHIQCMPCNVYKKGNYPAYASYMFKKYSLQKMESLEYLSRKPMKLTVSDYKILIVAWKIALETIQHG